MLVFEPYNSGSPVTRFAVEARYYVGSSYTVHTADITPPANTLTLSAPTYLPGVAYDIVVRAENAHGLSPYSDALKVLPATLSVSASPFGLAATPMACSTSSSEAPGTWSSWRPSW